MTSAVLPLVALAAAAVAMLLFYRPGYVAVMFGLALPLGALEPPGGIPMSIAMSVLVIAVAMVQRLQRGLLPLPRSWPTLMAVIWSVGVLFSVLLGPSLIKAATFGMWQIVSFLLAICWAEVAGRPSVFRKAVVATLIGGTIVALSGPFMASGEVEVAFGGSVVSNRPTGVFAQPNEYGLFCLLMLVFALGIFAGTRGSLRLLSGGASTAATVGLLISLSRGAWVGAAGGVIALLVLMPQFRRIFVVGGLGILAALSAIMLSPVQIPFASVVVSRALTINADAENPYDFRPLFRAEGLRLWEASPWFGQGPNSFPELSTGINSVARPGGAEHAHTLLLAIGSEQGLIGLAALIGLGASVVFAAAIVRPSLVATHRANRIRNHGELPKLRKSPPLSAVVTVSASAALAGFVVEGLADFAIRNPLSRTTLFLLIGWALAGYRLRKIELATLTTQASRMPGPLVSKAAEGVG
ncbi:MAG: O-antigen ligase family protein [Actinobacteria bacterium]|nr:O-antigen ligase family protein [Actinomycetota bacterium]